MRKRLIFSVVLFISILAIWMGDKWGFHPFCPFHKITGFPCPGCGGIRAAKALLSMDISTALYINPLSVVLCILFPVFLVLSWIDYFRKGNIVEKINTKISRPLPTLIIVSIIIANWIWGIAKGL